MEKLIRKIVPTTQTKKWKKESGRLQEGTATDLRFESSTSAKVLLHRLRKILDGIQYYATKQEEKKNRNHNPKCTQTAPKHSADQSNRPVQLFPVANRDLLHSKGATSYITRILAVDIRICHLIQAHLTCFEPLSSPSSPLEKYYRWQTHGRARKSPWGNPVNK